MKPKIYYATPIRGHMGKNATVDYMAKNCKRAKHNLVVLQAIFPDIEWVSVAPYDIVVQRLLAANKVAIDDVLFVDFQVGDECQGLFSHKWEPSGGADKEYARQLQKGKPCLELEPLSSKVWLCDMLGIEELVRTVLQRYNG